MKLEKYVWTVLLSQYNQHITPNRGVLPFTFTQKNIIIINCCNIYFLLAFFDRIIPPPTSGFTVNKRSFGYNLRQVKILPTYLFKDQAHIMIQLRFYLFFIDDASNAPNNSADIRTHKAIPKTEHLILQ